MSSNRFFCIKPKKWPLFEGGIAAIPRKVLAQQMLAWLQSLDAEVIFITDASDFDWPFVKQLFDDFVWPN